MDLIWIDCVALIWYQGGEHVQEFAQPFARDALASTGLFQKTRGLIRKDQLSVEMRSSECLCVLQGSEDCTTSQRCTVRTSGQHPQFLSCQLLPLHPTTCKRGVCVWAPVCCAVATLRTRVGQEDVQASMGEDCDRRATSVGRAGSMVHGEKMGSEGTKTTTGEGKQSGQWGTQRQTLLWG